MGEITEGYCLCGISRYSAEWREGKLCKGFKSQVWPLMFIDIFGEIWYLDGEYSFVPKEMGFPKRGTIPRNLTKI